MTMLTDIKANTCPYCGAAYTLDAGGCVSHCQTSESLKAIVRAAAEYDETYGGEERDLL